MARASLKFPRPGLREEPEAGMRIKNSHVAQVYDVDIVQEARGGDSVTSPCWFVRDAESTMTRTLVFLRSP
jgi:hypothetical protein